MKFQPPAPKCRRRLEVQVPRRGRFLFGDGREFYGSMRRFAILLALAGPLYACATAPHRAADVRLPAAYEAPAGGAALAPEALDRWWLLFGDPQLDALEDEAVRAAPDAR